MSKHFISWIILFCIFWIRCVIAQDMISIDGNASDWAHIPVLITDPNEKPGQYPAEKNILWSDQVDIKEVKFLIDGTDACWLIRFWGKPAWPNNPEGSNSRGHYGLLLDLDNDVNTGWNTAYYEGQETVLGEKKKNIGAEFYLEIGLDTDENAISYGKCKFYYGGDFSEMNYHLPQRKAWGQETNIFELPPRDDKSGTFHPELMTGNYTDPASGGQYAHAWGEDFVEVRQSLLPAMAYWQHKGFDYLKPGDKISLAAHVETILDDWGDDFSDGAEYEIRDYMSTAGSIAGTVKKEEDNTTFAGLQVEVKREEKVVAKISTDEAGRYFLALLPGDYSLEPVWGNMTESSKTALNIKAGRQTVIDFSVAKPKPPDILVKSAAVYQSLRSYKDSTTIFSQYIRPGMDSRSNFPIYFAYELPNRIRWEVLVKGMMGSMSSNMYCDGKSLLLYKIKSKEYMEKPAPPILTFEAFDEASAGFARSLTVQKLIMSKSPLDTLMKDVQRTKVHRSQELNGLPVTLVELIKPAGSFPGARIHRLARLDLPVAVKLWIGNKDHLIHKISYTLDLDQISDEMPASQRERFEGMKTTTAEIHSAIEVDSSLPDELFTFLLPKGSELVEHFKNTMDNQMRLSVFKGKPAPDFTLKNINDKDISLKDFKGKVCIVNFWATWCGPCRIEIPAFIALQKQYGNQEFSIIGISVDDGKEKVIKYADENQINYPMLMANQAVRATYGGIQAVPSTFVIDKKGIIRYTHLGVPGDQLTFQKEVEGLLAE